MRRSTTAPLLSLSVLLLGCQMPGRDAEPLTQKPPLFDGTGTLHREVTTDSPEAQRYFDQGLVWAFAFNHDEAVRSFREAARLDPDCAMAWWGVAFCNGPHINNTEQHSKAAWAAVQEALKRRDHADPIERALIDAVAKRYADPPPADRRPLDEAFAAAMGDVWHAHRGDPDVGTLYAEALMDLQPWDMWTKDGQPKHKTTEVIAVLEEVLAIDVQHPGANHLYVHAVEGGPHPENGAAPADRLRNAVPMSSHLVHMPSHIDAQLGRWSLAADQNANAIQANDRYLAQSPKQGFYRLYMLHNYHFRSFASMMEGCGGNAIEAARDMINSVPPEEVRAMAELGDPYMSIELEALMRFGRWDEILNEPAPLDCLPITTALWRFARGVAYAAKGQVEDALREQTSFRDAVKRVPEGRSMGVNPTENVLRIADHVLEGEIAYRQGRVDDAVGQLRAAAAIEDDLTYTEPPDWVQPVRHTLGAVLLEAGRHSAAEQAYREDLTHWPENGWSLYGLSQALKAQGKTAEATEAEQRFRKAWSRADVTIGASCLCIRK